MSNHQSGASTGIRPDPNAAVRRELARDHRPPRPVAALLAIALIVAGTAGLGGWLTSPGGLLASSRSNQILLEDSSSALHWSSGWTVVHTRSASGGSEHATSKAGASVSLIYYGSYLRIMSPTGRGRGWFQVTLDGVSTFVPTHAGSFHPRQIVFGGGRPGRRHVLKITVAGTTGHPLVAIDALVISANAPAPASTTDTTPTPGDPTPTPTPGDPTPTPTPGDPTPTPTPGDPTPTPTPGDPTPTPTPGDPTPTPTPTPSPTATPTPNPAGGAFVANNGNDANPGTEAQPWRTLQKAADSASGVVWVRAGTYASFTLRRNDLTFSGYPGETARISDGSAKDMVYIYQVNGATFENLSIQGGIQSGGAGIEVAASSNIVLRNNVFDSWVSGNRGFGIRTWNSTSTTISNNDIAHQAAGIQVSYTSDGVQILNNLIHDNNRMIVNTVSPSNDDHGANGVIFLKTTGATLASGNQLWGNRAPSYDYGYDGSAFEIFGASDVTITDNTMWNNKNVMETGTDGRPCNNVTFTRNVAWSGTTVPGYARGVVIACGSNSVIAFNTLDGFDISDISIVYSAGYKYQGSEIGLKVEDNILLSNGGPIYHLETPPSGVTVDRNVLWNRIGGSLVWDKTHNGTSWDALRSWYGFESHGLNADPLIVSLGARDYHLQAGSPAIDAGSVISGVSSSYLGSAPDIGRYENR